MFPQLYPTILYGLTTVNIPPKKLDVLMGALYYKALSMLGVNRCIAKEWSLLLERYQGLGLPNFTTDYLAAKLQYVQSKWGLDSAGGTHIILHAYEAFLVEVKVYGNVFKLPYDTAGCLATDRTWFKNLWEFAAELKVKVIFPPEMHFHMIRDNGKSLIGWFLEEGLPP